MVYFVAEQASVKARMDKGSAGWWVANPRLFRQSHATHTTQLGCVYSVAAAVLVATGITNACANADSFLQPVPARCRIFAL